MPLHLPKSVLRRAVPSPVTEREEIPGRNTHQARQDQVTLMPNVNVDLLVVQGSLNSATAAQSIGTDGCTLCIGIVAILADGSKICAHFDCASPGNTAAQRTAIQAATLQILQTAMPAAPTSMGACTTANLNHSTGAIAAGIQQFFAATAIHDTNGIYALANGTIGTVTGSNQVTGTNATANTTASIPQV